MIAAFQKDDALLADIRSVPASPACFQLWWLGQSGFLLHWNGAFLLMDPYLSDSLTNKYAATDKPHVRMSERVIDPSRLDFVEFVTSSHHHTDHLDPETLAPLARAHPGLQLFAPAASLELARERLGGESAVVRGLDVGPVFQAGPFTLRPSPAAHNTVERDSQGRCVFLGLVVRFGNFSLYHSGDTLWHAGLVTELLPEKVDVALLPINGNLPERRVAGNLNGTEAACLAKAIGARLAIPHHFHQFQFNTAEPDEFTATCHRLGQAHAVLRGGERVDVVEKEIEPRI